MTEHGRQLGSYELLRRIGVGGMAEVYEAVRRGPEGFNKRLAVKVLLPEAREEQSVVDMFIDEATIVADLQHPNVIDVYDFGQVDGTYYLAMELIDGWTLRQLERRQRNAAGFPVAAAAFCVREICRALAYVHGAERRIVHRDVTPQNVFVDRQGQVKLGDFGIAKAEARRAQTVGGQIKGKLAYLAPEQVTEEQVTPQTDVYAAGLILFELLAGRQLITGNRELDLIQTAINPPRIAPSSLRPEAAALDRVVERALEPHPTLRYATAELFAADLDRYLDTLSLQGRERSPGLGALMSLIAGIERTAADEASRRSSPMGGAGTLPGLAPSTAPPDERADDRAGPADTLARTMVTVRSAEAEGTVALPPMGRRARGGDEVAAPDRDPSHTALATRRPSGLVEAAASRPRRWSVVVGGLAVLAVGGLVAALAWPTGEQQPLAVAPSVADAGASPAEGDATPADGGVQVADAGRPRRRRARVARRRPRAPNKPRRSPAKSSAKKPPQKMARVAGAKVAAAKPSPGPDVAALRQRLSAVPRSARAKGLFSGDDPTLTRLLGAARRQLAAGDGQAAATITRAEQRVAAFQIDRRFAERKLARLSAAIKRANLPEARRQRMARLSQRILQLIIEGQYVAASRRMSEARGALR